MVVANTVLKIYLKNQEGYSKEYEDYRAEKE